MALQGRYYRMWQAQAQYYQEDQKMHDYLRAAAGVKKGGSGFFPGLFFVSSSRKSIILLKNYESFSGILTMNRAGDKILK